MSIFSVHLIGGEKEQLNGGTIFIGSVMEVCGIYMIHALYELKIFLVNKTTIQAT